jgi:hypothetical protein
MSIEGAGLIAQVLPVLLLILAIERRALGPVQVPRKGAPRRFRRLAYLFAGAVAISFALATEYACLTSVAEQQPLEPWTARLVTAYMLLLGIIVSITLLDLYAASVLGLDLFRQRRAQIDKDELVKARAKHVYKLSQNPKTKN